MNYHKPDKRWAEIFGIENFEQYESALVVKGKFHSLVPSDVVEAFQQAEYMMAFAYYHYPLYDEALSKILRIFEMALTLKYENAGVKRKKETLFELMDKVDKAEPAKMLGTHFGAIRSLRNSFMHPQKYSYMGPVSHGYAIRCVSLLNIIFMPEQLFIENRTETERMQNFLQTWKERLSILFIDNGKFLISSINIRSAIYAGDRWLYLMNAVPIHVNTFESLLNHRYLKPFCFTVEAISVKDDHVIAKTAGKNELIIFKTNSDNRNEYKYQASIADLKKMESDDIYMYEMNNEIEIDKAENRFLLEYLSTSELMPAI